ncbi:MAG: YycC family protein [Candidatus Pristimantibacillus lignocellulolyticus]|uniref:YycC family protein n=1 Tax=Candidatus Pristimantibacillus lignocellulolyticus TaxID=2994561 RepID=A0A9J6Z9L6_9BACL|nr:MAG: YycC family protein [Candidatus Pristimantibacillus lignocellulolyticus]
MLKQLSPETAMKLAQQLGIPIEQLVHTPRHIVLQKLAQLAQEEQKTEQQQASKESE